jgi:hypothetical protein
MQPRQSNETVKCAALPSSRSMCASATVIESNMARLKACSAASEPSLAPAPDLVPRVAGQRGVGAQPLGVLAAQQAGRRGKAARSAGTAHTRKGEVRATARGRLPGAALSE